METLTVIFTLLLAIDYFISRAEYRHLDGDIKTNHSIMEKKVNELENQLAEVKERLNRADTCHFSNR